MSIAGDSGASGARLDPVLAQQLALLGGAEAAVRPGDVIAGRYRVEGVLGVGGMGVVVSGMHLELGQRVAIKLVLPSAVHDESLRERFLREARAAARLRSAHVTKVYDVGQLPSGAPYIVMELLEGCDLATFLQRNGPLPPATAADFMAQACEAVAEAHAQGIIHRDIKPQNLFVTAALGGDPLVKVLDFGVSKDCARGGDNLTKSLVVMGSPMYMSPEQMRSSRDVDARTDVWSLGVVLFELLAGRPPFDGDSMPALCLKIAAEPAPSLATVRPDVPSGLVSVVTRCLEKSPSARFPDVGALTAALAPFVPSASSATVARALMVSSGSRSLAGMHSEAPVSRDTQPEPRGSGRVTVAVAMAFVACLAFLGGAGWRHMRAESRGAAIAPTTDVARAAPPPPAPQTVAPVAPQVPVTQAPAPVAVPVTAPPPVAPAKPVFKPVRGRFPRRAPTSPPPAASSPADDIPATWSGQRPATETPQTKDGDIPSMR